MTEKMPETNCRVYPNHVIDYFIPKDAEGTYFTIPFPVPEGMECITVSYGYETGTVDLGLMDGSGQFIGWSGSGRKHVWVGPHNATPGYRTVPLAPGTWQILVGAYKIPDPGLNVRYEIAYQAQKPRWLTGDLHMHSDASDGEHSIYVLAKKAQKRGLDFIAVANHNNYSENFSLPRVPELTLIPAVEWTHYRGHINLYGVAAPFDSFVANSEDEMLALVGRAKEKGALVSVCHPRDKNCGYTWRDNNCFDLIEVWNGLMRPTNTYAIKWWHNMLLEGRKIPLIGGSDYHRDLHPAMIGHPVTRVYAKSPAVCDILEAVAMGRAYVAAVPGGVTLELCAGDGIMGDTVPWYEGLCLDISAQGLGLGMRVRLVTDEGIVDLNKKKGRLTARVPVLATWKFAYLMVVRRLFGFERIGAITNPIYFAG